MAARPVKLHPDAIADGRGAREWYEVRSESAAAAFMAELDHAIAEISAHPHRWPLHKRGTRRFLMRRFPYLVVYREVDDLIEVVAVAHGSRRPDYWKDR